MDQYKNVLREIKNEVKSLCQRIESCQRRIERLIEVYKVQETKMFKIQIQKETEKAQNLELDNFTINYHEKLDVSKVEEEIGSVKSMCLLNHHMIQQIQVTVWKLEGLGIEKRFEEVEEVIGVQARVIKMLEELGRMGMEARGEMQKQQRGKQRLKK